MTSAILASGEANKTGLERAATILRAALVVAVLVGAALRLWQFAGNASLWIDEAALATGIVNLNLWSLLTMPLPANQVAPKGFLLVEKLAVMAMDPSDWVLKLFPLACSLIALGVFSRLAKRMLDGIGALVAVLLFATAVPFIAYGSMVKQFSTEVCVAVVLWWVTYKLISEPLTVQRAVLAAVLGALLVWFSHSGVIMVTALGAVLLVWPTPQPGTTSKRRLLLPVVVCWIASSVAVTLAAFATMVPETSGYLQSFWAGGFAPVSVGQFLKTLWPWNQFLAVFGPGLTHSGLGYPLPAFFATLTAVGFLVLWRQRRQAALLLIAPMVVTLGAACLRQYPFSDRLILFLLPSFIFALGAAVEGVRRLLWRFSHALATLAAVALLLPAIYPLATTCPVYRTEDVKPVLSYLQAQRQPGDATYVYYGAAPAVTFYAAQFGLSRTDFAVGDCHRGDSRRYLRELDTFRGRARVWILMTHPSRQYREREDIFGYLDKLGSKLDSLVIAPHGISPNLGTAEAYLYDLSAAEKLSQVSADSFQLTGPAQAGRPFCEVGPQSIAQSDFP